MMNGLIKEIKDRLSIMDAVRRYTNVEVRKRGASYWCKCLNHNERTPSLQIQPEKNRYRCFSCGGYGDQLDFVAAAKGMSLNETINLLVHDLGIKDMSEDEKKQILQTRLKEQQEHEAANREKATIELQERLMISASRRLHKVLNKIQAEQDLDRADVALALNWVNQLDSYIDDIEKAATMQEKSEIVGEVQKWTLWGQMSLVQVDHSWYRGRQLESNGQE